MLKMFTLLECESICLLYLLVCTFNTVNVFKPVKSKEGNSEVYVVCTEYIGRDKLAPWLPTLMEKYGKLLSIFFQFVKHV
jgi:cap2 methyltransferase